MLDAYGIKSHRRFELLIEENRQSDDLTFREFLTTLSAYDPSIKEVGAADRAAGRQLAGHAAQRACDAPPRAFALSGVGRRRGGARQASAQLRRRRPRQRERRAGEGV